MLTIKIGSFDSTLSKLNAFAIGSNLKNKFQDLHIEYIHSKELSDKDKKNSDFFVYSTYELDLKAYTKSTFKTLLTRADQREIILFKKNITSLRGESIRLLSFHSIDILNTVSFLKEYLPISIQNKEILIQTFGSDPIALLKRFPSNEIDGIVMPINILDRILSPHLIDEFQDEDMKKCQKFVRGIVDDAMFMIPPLSLCPNYPAEGFLFAEVWKGSEQIGSLINSIADPEGDKLTRAELRLESKMLDGDTPARTTFLIRPYGTIEYKRMGKDSTCKLLESCEEKFQISEIWPPNARMAPRQRERLGYKIPPESDLYVSRGYAYPLDLVSDPTKQIVWAAGLSTWKDLSSRNLWVHGTNDGLGESEPIKLSILLGRKLKFIKLSHLDSDTNYNTFPLISTYRLSSPEIPNDFNPSKIKAAFWRSSSEFERITTRFPELKEVIHFVSPGSTYTKIQRELGHKPNFRLHVALSFDDWRRQNIIQE